MNSKTRGNTARKIKENLRITGMYAFLVVICVVIIYPILWIVFSSFNPSQSMFSSTLIPKEMSLSNYVWLFTSPDSDYLLWFRNSLKISVIVMVLQVTLVSFTAYALSLIHILVCLQCNLLHSFLERPYIRCPDS